MTPKRPPLIQRGPRRFPETSAVRTAGATHPGGAPIVMEPAWPAVNLRCWLEQERAAVLGLLRTTGAILFRGFSPDRTPQTLAEIATALDPALIEYTYRSTPRTALGSRVYSSTEYPEDHTIPLHNEMSYSLEWPLRIWFCCKASAATGGETPIADSRRVYDRIPPAVREEFERRGVLYLRNYGSGLDLGWPTVFGTDRRSEVEQFCASHSIEWEWLDRDRLRTRQKCQASARHPETGEMVWFNQAHLFHTSSLPEEVRLALESQYAPEDLPRQCFLGDGRPIPREYLDLIRQTYAAQAIVFSWQEGDLLVLDNMLFAHGRMPYTGRRSVMVAMAGAHRSQWRWNQ